MQKSRWITVGWCHFSFTIFTKEAFLLQTRALLDRTANNKSQKTICKHIKHQHHFVSKSNILREEAVRVWNAVIRKCIRTSWIYATMNEFDTSTTTCKCFFQKKSLLIFGARKCDPVVLHEFLQSIQQICKMTNLTDIYEVS